MLSSLDGNDEFYVKVTIISLSGITTTLISPRGKNKKMNGKLENNASDSNRVRAFVSFSFRSSHSNAIMSQPIHESSSTKHAAVWEDKIPETVFTSNANLVKNNDNNALGAASTIFPIHLLKEDLSLNNDENNISKTLPFSPELIDVSIGLCKGDETIHLGVSTFVISGQHVENQIFDLPVQRRSSPKKDSNRHPITPSNSTLDKHDSNSRSSSISSPVSQLTSKLSFAEKLSPKKIKSFFKLETKRGSLRFENENRVFGITFNAILRIQLNVTESSSPSGKIMQSQIESARIPRSLRESFSGLISTCDSGFITIPTQADISALSDAGVLVLSEKVIRPRHVEIHAENYEEIVEVVDVDENQGGPSIVYEIDDYASVKTDFIVSSVKLLSPHEIKMQRMLKRQKSKPPREQNLIERVVAGEFCGISDDVSSAGYSTDDINSPLSFDSDAFGDEHAFDDTHEEEIESTRRQLGEMNVNDDKNALLDGSFFLNDVNSLEENEDQSVGDETFESLQNAKMTLRRYADRVGVEMADLIEGQDEGFLDREGSTVGSTIDGTLERTVQTIDDQSDGDSSDEITDTRDNSTVQSRMHRSKDASNKR